MGVFKSSRRVPREREGQVQVGAAFREQPGQVIAGFQQVGMMCYDGAQALLGDPGFPSLQGDLGRLVRVLAARWFRRLRAVEEIQGPLGRARACFQACQARERQSALVALLCVGEGFENPPGVVRAPQTALLKDGITVVTAGTADLPAAEEAVLTATLMGNDVTLVSDVGVAGLHRLLDQLPALQKAHVLVVVAGMDAALVGVVSGLVSVPVIAVPTSTGYGASFDGLAPLLSMLNSCAPGVSVVNIDNGFGAGHQAALTNAIRFDTSGGEDSLGR